MTIGFDAKRAVRNLTGLGNYSRLVVESMADFDPSCRLLLYTPDMRDNPRLDRIRRLRQVEFITPSGGADPLQHGALWRTFGIPRRLRHDGVDVYHGLSNELPLNIRSAGVASVVTVHDLIYRRLPYCYSLPDRVMYDFKYGRSCRNADRIIAISECTKRDIIDCYGVDESRIDVIYQGCAPEFSEDIPEARLEETRRRLGLPERFILQVGTIEKRKNLELTVRALSALGKRIPLVAVGRDSKGYSEYVMRIARENGVADLVDIRGGVSFPDLTAIYRLASVAAYPSRYEGFGLPVLEALSGGTPVVAATGSCLEEAGGDAAVYVSPDSPREMAEALGALLAGGPTIESRIEAGRRHARKFDNSKIPEKIMSSYRKALHEFRTHRQWRDTRSTL